MDPSNLIYRPFCRNDFAGVRALYQDVWGEQRDERYDIMRWLETFEGLSVAIVALDQENYVGFYMIWPLPMTDGTSNVLGGQSIDTMTHPRYRGHGIFVRMARECY